MGKVRLADLVTPTANTLVGFNKTSQKHVDFVLCRADSFEIQCVIELDDSSHEEPGRKARDRFVDAALSSANIRIIRVKAQSGYTGQFLRQVIKDATQRNYANFQGKTMSANAGTLSPQER